MGALLFALAAALCADAAAATFTVDTTTDVLNTFDGVTSLSEALAGASAGDEVVFSAAAFPAGVRTTIVVAAITRNVRAGVTINGDDRVTLSGAALGSGHGLILLGDNVVDGLEIAHFPGVGILVDNDDALFDSVTQVGDTLGNVIHDNGRSGVQINGVGLIDYVLFNELGVAPDGTASGNCRAPVGACAGVYVSASVDGVVVIDENVIVDTRGAPSASQGSAVLLAGGAQHVVEGNRLGVLADVGNTTMGNTGNGVSVTGALVGDVLVTENVIGGNAGHGVLLGIGSQEAVVQGNWVGVNGAGIAARPNGKDGVRIFGSDGHAILDNVISGNGESGIRMLGADGANWHSDGVISGNIIGLDEDGLLAIPNGAHGISSDGSEGRYLIGGSLAGDGNVIGGNPNAGMRLVDPGHIIRSNRVGVDGNGGAAVPNGTMGGWAGVHLGGADITLGVEGVSFEALAALDGPNQISGNASAGVRLGSGSHRALVAGNLVGTDATGAEPLGNGGDGIVLADGQDADVVENVVVDNGGDGIVVTGTNAVVSGARVQGNRVGVAADGADLGNAGNGIDVAQGGFAVTAIDVTSNEVRGNGEIGIRVSAAQQVALEQNLVTENGTCGILLDGGANGGLVPPVLLVRNDLSLTGTVAAPPAGRTIVAVEVFWDADTEAGELLGLATVAGTSWSLHRPLIPGMPPDPFPEGGRVSATVRYDNGDTSGLPPGCNDGCSVPAAAVCEDGNPCTTESCDAVAGCVFVDDDGAACSDGDACTFTDTCAAGVCAGTFDDTCTADRCEEVDPVFGDVLNDCDDGLICTVDVCHSERGCNHNGLECGDGNQCTSDACVEGTGCVFDPRPVDFTCDDNNACTGWGTCDGAGACVDVDPDPPCLTCANGATTYATSTCDPVGGCQYESTCGDGYCSPWDHCDCPGDCFVDTDHDGAPDAWEDAQEFTDCDGVVHPLPNADPIVPNVWVAVDFMEKRDYLGNLLHTHQPKPGVLEELEATALDKAGVILTFEVDTTTPLDHHQVLTWANAPAEPGCTDWAPFYGLKQENFEGWRTPVYHYLIMGHQMTDCTSSRSGQAETPGNDYMVTLGAFGLTGSYDDQRNTILHELGHNFDLQHGGYDDGDNFTPNYVSIMNYRFQLPGMTELVDADPGPAYDLQPAGNAADFSHVALPVLDEGSLVEVDGIEVLDTGGSPHPDSLLYSSRADCPDGSPMGVLPLGPHNWDCDLDEAETVPLEADVSGNNGIQHTLDGRNDWATLDLEFQCTDAGGVAPHYLDGAPAPTGDGCASSEEAATDRRMWPWRWPRLDLEPGCAQNPVATDATGHARVAIRGAAELDVTTLNTATVRLGGAYALGTAVVDEDLDGFDDLIAQFDAADMTRAGPGGRLEVSAERTTAEIVYGLVRPTWVATAIDADSDGVMDVCDACPAVAAPLASADGCP